MTTIVIPRATAKAEALAENIAKLQDAESQLAEKLKKVREAKAAETAALQAWLVESRAPLDIPVSVGPGRTATLYEKETRGSISVSYLTDTLTERLGKKAGDELVAHIYDSRPSEIEYNLRFADVVRQAEEKKRRVEAAKANPKPKKAPRKKAATTSAGGGGGGGGGEDYDDNDENDNDES